MSIVKDSKSVSAGAQDTFTDAMFCEAGSKVSISISGTWAGTVTLQRSFDSGQNWHDVPNPDDTFGWTANTQKTHDVDEGQHVRLGIKTGDYTSGTAVCRIGKG